MGLVFVLIAALLAAFCNLLLKMSIRSGGSSQGYLAVQVTFTFLVMIFLEPARAHNFHIHLPVIVIGMIGGLILGFFFWAFGRALETGSASVTIAALNATSLVPGFVLAGGFGVAFGHILTGCHLWGTALVLLGVLWAGRASVTHTMHRGWYTFLIVMFLCHSLYLIFLQWWAMLLNPHLPPHRLLPSLHSDDIYWFMPSIFFVAALFQIGILIQKERKWPSRQEMLFGLWGGIANGVCSYFLILAPQVAAPWENALLFPTFSVGIILLCNGWSHWLYREHVHWKACTLSIIGIFVGALSWLRH